jgi:choline/glycine/proline betaine transport protein
VLLFTWLVTSIDSATLVICMLLKRDQRDVSTLQKTVWGVLLGLITGLLLVAGGIGALQAASIVAGLPVGLVMLGIGYGVLRRIRRPT